MAGQRWSGGASWVEARTLANGAQACFALIHALGFPIYPRTKRLLYRSPASGPAAMLWFISRVRSFRELLAGGAPEARALARLFGPGDWWCGLAVKR